jgi:hypothetical protein
MTVHLYNKNPIAKNVSDKNTNDMKALVEMNCALLTGGGCSE